MVQQAASRFSTHRAARVGPQRSRVRSTGSDDRWILLVECVCVYYCRTYYKAVRVGEEESGGHVL
jgi:hypothetical protein